MYPVPDIIRDNSELFSGERMGVHEGVHSWEEVSLGRRGVEGAEEGGLGENNQGDRVSGFEEVNNEEDSKRRIGRRGGKRWTDREVVADPVGDLGEHVG
jgi:hypothetical protein